MANAALDVLVWVEGIRHPETRGRSRHELHQSAGAAPRNRPWIELGFGLDDRGHQDRRNVVADGDLSDVRLDLDDLGDLDARVGSFDRLASHLHDLGVRLWPRPEVGVRGDDREQQDSEPQRVARERRERVSLEASDRRFRFVQEFPSGFRAWQTAFWMGLCAAPSQNATPMPAVKSDKSYVCSVVAS